MREAERSLGREAAAELAVLYRQPSLRTQKPERFERLYRTRVERFEAINRTIQAYFAVGNSLEERLGEVRRPTFIAHGDADTTIPVGCGHDLHRGISGSVLHVIPGAGHGLLTNEPDRMRSLMLDFFERVAQPAG